MWININCNYGIVQNGARVNGTFRMEIRWILFRCFFFFYLSSMECENVWDRNVWNLTNKISSLDHSNKINRFEIENLKKTSMICFAWYFLCSNYFRCELLWIEQIYWCERTRMDEIKKNKRQFYLMRTTIIIRSTLRLPFSFVATMRATYKTHYNKWLLCLNIYFLSTYSKHTHLLRYMTANNIKPKHCFLFWTK